MRAPKRAVPPRRGERIIETTAELQAEIESLRARLADTTRRTEELLCVEESLLRYRRLLIERETFLTQLSRRDIAATQDLDEALRAIVTDSARLLGVDRVSIWRANGTALCCVAGYEQWTNRHFRGAERRFADHGPYFQALEAGEPIATTEARADPLTASLAAVHLVPSGVTAVLDAPIIVDRRVEGVIAFEQTEDARPWLPEDRLFAIGLANVVGLAIERRARARVEQSLALQHERAARVFDATPDVVARISRELRFTYVNAALARLVEAPPHMLVGRFVAEATLAPHTFEDVIDRLTRIFATGRSEHVDFTLETPAECRHFESIVIPDLDADGAVEGVLMLATDVTARTRDARSANGSASEREASHSGVRRSSMVEMVPWLGVTLSSP